MNAEQWISLAIQIFAVGFALLNVAMALYDNRKNLDFIWSIWKRFRFFSLLQIIGIIFLIFLSYKALVFLSPVFGYGWLDFFSKTGGNILISPILTAFNSDIFIVRCVPALFLFAFLLSLPFMARLEENIFRRGYHMWGKIFRQSFFFGLMHMVIGIPLGVAVALIIPGLFFAYEYRRVYLQLIETRTQKEARNEAVLTSTTYHTLMNTIFIGYALILCIISV
jgi:hypothetical protein